MPSRMSISVNLCRWRQSNQKQQRLLLCFCYNAASGPTATLYSQATQALNHIDGLLGWKSRVLSCQFVEYNGDGRWERTQRQTDRGRNTVERSIYWHNNDSSQLVLYLVTVFYWLLPNVLLTEEGALYECACCRSQHYHYMYLFVQLKHIYSIRHAHMRVTLHTASLCVPNTPAIHDG